MQEGVGLNYEPEASGDMRLFHGLDKAGVAAGHQLTQQLLGVGVGMGSGLVCGVHSINYVTPRAAPPP